jgi:hypothetical protein
MNIELKSSRGSEGGRLLLQDMSSLELVLEEKHMRESTARAFLFLHGLLIPLQCGLEKMS